MSGLHVYPRCDVYSHLTAVVSVPLHTPRPIRSDKTRAQGSQDPAQRLPLGDGRKEPSRSGAPCQPQQVEWECTAVCRASCSQHALVWHTGWHLSWLVSLCTELGIVFQDQLCLWAWRYSNPQMHRNPSGIRACKSTSLHMGAHGVRFFRSRRYRNLENMNWADLGCNNILGKQSPASSLFLGLSLYVFISLVVRTHERHWNGLKGHRHSLKKKKKSQTQKYNTESSFFRLKGCTETG